MEPAHGKRNRGRPKTTWRRTMLADLKQLRLTIGEAESVAKDRNRWRNLARPLAPTMEIWVGKVREQVLFHSFSHPSSDPILKKNINVINTCLHFLTIRFTAVVVFTWCSACIACTNFCVECHLLFADWDITLLFLSKKKEIIQHKYYC